MSTRDVVGLVAGVAVVAVGLVRLGQVWRGGDRSALRVAPFTWFSYPTRRGLYRSQPTIIVGFALALVGVVISMVISARTGRAPQGAELWALGVPGGAGIALMLIVVPMVILFNRPKFLVPPPNRAEWGAWMAWRRARQLKRALRSSRRGPVSSRHA